MALCCLELLNLMIARLLRALEMSLLVVVVVAKAVVKRS